MNSFSRSLAIASALTAAPMVAEASHPRTPEKTATEKQEVNGIQAHIGGGFKLLLDPVTLDIGGTKDIGSPDGDESLNTALAFNLGTIGDLTQLELGVIASAQAHRTKINGEEHDADLGVGPLMVLGLGQNDLGVNMQFNVDRHVGDPALADLQVTLDHTLAGSSTAVGVGYERTSHAGDTTNTETLRLSTRIWGFGEIGVEAGIAEVNSSKVNAAVLGADLTFIIPVNKAVRSSSSSTSYESPTEETDTFEADENPCGDVE